MRVEIGLVCVKTLHFMKWTWSITECLQNTQKFFLRRVMMMIAFITFKSSLVPLIEGPCSSNPWEFEFSGFWRNRTEDLGINSPLLWPTEHLCNVLKTSLLFFFIGFLIHLKFPLVCICVYVCERERERKRGYSRVWVRLVFSVCKTKQIWTHTRIHTCSHVQTFAHIRT